MKRIYFTFITAIILFSLLNLNGFAQNKNEFKSIEDKFDSNLNAESIKARLKYLSAHPHHVGSPWDKSNAEFMAFTI